MKKTLVALAALAAFGSASAEVVLYGKADVGISSSTSTGGVDQGMKVSGNNYETSRFGVKGGADLSGGVKAIFQYEQKVTLGDTSASNLVMNRVTTAGFTGSFGTVTAGLQWSPYDSAWGFDQVEYNGFSPAGSVWYNGAHGDNGTAGMGNVKNSIQYTTPDMNGFNASIMYANNADKTATTDATTYVGLGANYTAGPLAINFGYEAVASSAQLGTTNTTPSDKTNAYIIGASYNLGVATIGAGYEQANVTAGGGAVSGKDTGYTLSASIPVSAATKFDIGYATETTTANGSAAEGKSTGFGAQVIYNWTKQMAIYGGVLQTKTTSIVAPTTPAEITATKYAAGLRYNF